MAKDQNPEVGQAAAPAQAPESGLENKLQNNPRTIMGLIIAIIAIVAIVVGGYFGWYLPHKEKQALAANDAIGLADNMLAVNPDSALVMYKQVVEDFGGDAGNRAALNAAILLYKNGEYQQAIDYCKKYSGKETVVAAAAKALEGDCYVNLDQLDEAVKLYKQAAKIAGDNPYYTPYFLLKQARVYAAQGNYDAEIAVYESLQKNYPQVNASEVARGLEAAKVNKENNAPAKALPVIGAKAEEPAQPEAPAAEHEQPADGE